MKNKIILPFFLTTVLVGGYLAIDAFQQSQPTQAAQSIWKQFSSSKGNFKVLMPGKTSQLKRIVNTDAGKITVYGFRAIRPNEAVYGVTYSDVPSKIIKTPKDVNDLFNGTIQGFAESVQGSVVSQRNIKLGTYPGREIKVQIFGGATAKSRMYLVKQRLYQTLAVTKKEESLSKSINGFLNSFQVINKPAASPKSRQVKKPTVSPKVVQEQLNAKLKQAVCNQNWSQAVTTVNQMINMAPKSGGVREQLVTYRGRLQNMARNKEVIPAGTLTGCSPVAGSGGQ